MTEMSIAPLRIVWFGRSIISDWDNPVATTVRATMRALEAAGHLVTFLEPRNSEPFVSVLAARGWAAYRDFQRLFPDLTYRTYDLPRRAERDVWLSREAALVDAVVVQSDAPAEIFEWLARVPDSPMIRVLIDLDDQSAHRALFDIVATPTPMGTDAGFGPAVLPAERDELIVREGTIVAVYSEFDLDASPDTFRAASTNLVAVGAGASPELPFVSEAALVERYQRAARVIVFDRDPSPFAEARAMLAVASGAETHSLQRDGTLLQVDSFVSAIDQAETLARSISVARSQNIHSRVIRPINEP